MEKEGGGLKRGDGIKYVLVCLFKYKPNRNKKYIAKPREKKNRT